MRASSTAFSLAIHTVVAIGLINASAAGRPRVPTAIIIEPVSPPGGTARTTPALPAAPTIDTDGLVLPSLDTTLLPVTLPKWSLGPDTSGRVLAGTWGPGSPDGPIDVVLTDEYPELLAGPPPVYPDLLRQAGIEGRVVLEAIVDTAGRVERGSIVAISGHPALAAAAERSLLASLFRPARVHGRSVRVRVRVPFEFTLSNRR
jgi:TonB family protein